MWVGRYKLPDGRWQNWTIFEDFQETVEVLRFHAQGRDFEIVSFDTFSLVQEAEESIKKGIALMERSKGAFKSKTIAHARTESEKALGVLQKIIHWG